MKQIVNYKDRTLTVTDWPYLDHVERRVGDTVEVIRGDVYRAPAEDTDGNHYEVYWTRLTDGEVSDWSTYVVFEVTAI